MGGMGGGGQGFFSIPPERVISVPFNSVCLAHGKAEPTSASRYRLIPVSKLTSDPVLYELLATVGTGRVDSQAAQAAAWTMTDKMTWQQLAAKQVTHLGGHTPTPYFTPAQLLVGQQLVAHAIQRAEDRKDEKPATEQPRTARAPLAK